MEDNKELKAVLSDFPDSIYQKVNIDWAALKGAFGFMNVLYFIEILHAKLHRKEEVAHLVKKNAIQINNRKYLYYLLSLADDEMMAQLKRDFEQEELQKPMPNPIKRKPKLNFKPKNKKNINNPKVNSLIEKFIEEEPSISRPSLYQPMPEEDKSAPFAEKKAFPVSETLAQILVKQEKVEEALKIYQQLKLNNPEKSAYFAAKIEQLNNKIK